MIRRYCIQHLPDDWYLARIPSYSAVADGAALSFRDITITDPAAADACDQVMADAGWGFAGVDPVTPLPSLVLGGDSGTQWEFQISNTGVLTLVAYP